jgi:hypothetical protein
VEEKTSKGPQKSRTSTSSNNTIPTRLLSIGFPPLLFIEPNGGAKRRQQLIYEKT